jgi:hypothetical protein
VPLGHLPVDGDGLEAGARFVGGVRFELEALGRVQAGLDALRQRYLLLGREQGYLSDLLEVHAHGIEASDLAPLVPRRGLAELAET